MAFPVTLSKANCSGADAETLEGHNCFYQALIGDGNKIIIFLKQLAML
jgi:hypothetical protein